MKSVKEANWGCGGAMCLIFSISILAIYFITGGLPAKGGRILKGENAAACAFLMSGLFFLLGILSISASILLKLGRNTKKRKSN